MTPESGKLRQPDEFLIIEQNGSELEMGKKEIDDLHVLEMIFMDGFCVR
jgi:hypothetical protein